MKIFFILSFVMGISLKTFAAVYYEQGCRVIGEDDYVKYVIETDGLFKGASWKLILTAFEDEKCEKPYLNYKQSFQVANREGESVDFMSEKVTYTALTDETANALRLMNYCDSTSWIRGTEITVTGKICGDYVQLSAHQTFFQILKTDGNQLSLGLLTSQQNGRSLSKRPTSYDIPFQKP